MDPVGHRPRWAIVVALATAALAVVAIVSLYVGRPAQAASVVMVGAGDIAHCSTTTDEATAKLLDGISGTVFTLGDNVYNSGTSAEFANCYNPTWGRHKARTKPSVGNHEYLTSGASGYFNYFGAAAGDPKKGYYSYDRGDWHVIVLNSNCSQVPCAAGSAQDTWLRADLAAHPNKCTLAYFHAPLYSSGKYGNSTSVRPFWKALYQANADVVLSGHEHDYERFAPQNPYGAFDSARGIREFVVGTGGTYLRPFGTIKPNSQSRNASTPGVLKLTLNSGGYAWKFVPVAGKTFTDSGTASCH
jgi:acid phosphatase type 7